jgi:uncharacterized protein (TIGR02145 family)
MSAPKINSHFKQSTLFGMLIVWAFCLQFAHAWQIQGTILDMKGQPEANVIVGIQSLNLKDTTQSDGQWVLKSGSVSTLSESNHSLNLSDFSAPKIQVWGDFYKIDNMSENPFTAIVLNSLGQIIQKHTTSSANFWIPMPSVPHVLFIQNHSQKLNYSLLKTKNSRLTALIDTLTLTKINGLPQQIPIQLADSVFPPIILNSTSLAGWTVPAMMMTKYRIDNGQPYLVPTEYDVTFFARDSFIDCRDSNKYQTSQVNGLLWMSKNLSYNPLVVGSNSWCLFNCKVYGQHFNWIAAQNACPDGWRLPNKQEWERLIAWARGDTLAGDRLKDNFTWNNGGKNTDSLRISLQAAGLRTTAGLYFNRNYAGYYWLSDLLDSLYIGVGAGSPRIFLGRMGKEAGMSVRCVSEPGVNMPQTCGNSSITLASSSSQNASSQVVASSASGGISPNWHVAADTLPVSQIKVDTFTTIDTRDNTPFKTFRINHPNWRQVWTAENMRIKPALATDSSWCYGNADTSCAFYGRLYSWSAAQSICPSGFRLPSQADWNKVVSVNRGDSLAGLFMKRSVTWNFSGSPPPDSMHFSAVAAGRRQSSDGKFYGMRSNTYFWLSDAVSDPKQGLYFGITSNSSLSFMFTLPKTMGFSVRCVQDAP